jgi:ABC-type dipeptide/oligopeptide/nickel transport system ATPase component
LPNLISLLTKIFPQVDAVKNGDLVVCIGKTGCGKSTMLNSLIHGTEALNLFEGEYFIDFNGQQKKKLMKVIDLKPDVSTPIKIGHSNSVSETFLPNIFKNEETGTVFVDPAGFSDTSGNFVNLVNSLIYRYMFLQAAKVRFLLLITAHSINESRGADVKI